VKGRPDYQSTQEMLKQPVPPEYYHPKSNELATAFGEAAVAALYGKGAAQAAAGRGRRQDGSRPERLT
jgi:hypothetical protein